MAGAGAALPFDPFVPRRRATRVVRIGGVAVGGDEPIRIQSMTNTNTLDTRATVEQVTRLAEAGCEIVRVTAPSIRDAENLAEIKKVLRERRIEVPLVADIHFTPNAAMIAAGIVEKVRINPGNYADKKRFEVREYGEHEYAEELERVAARFRPLVLRCKQHGVAMRIGTNHGSLSDRVMNRFGDTPEGMVESALEFLDVCEAEAYFDVVFSMKSSNTQVAIAAYRLLAARLAERANGRPSYPFHVGVTEAGDAEDGRIKSAIGIGALLEDGLGDTIRVSLTEDPVREVPVARAIVERAGVRARRPAVSRERIALRERPFADAFAHARRATNSLVLGADDEARAISLGAGEPVRVELDRPGALVRPDETAAQLAIELAALTDVACESLLVSAEGRAPAAALAACSELVGELAAVGVVVPVGLRFEPADDAAGRAIARALTAALEAATAPTPTGNRMPATSSKATRPARVVVRIDTATGDPVLAELADAAARVGFVLEWELAAQEPALPALVERAWNAATVRGADRILASLAPGASPHAVRVLAAALATTAGGRTPIVLRYALEPSRSQSGAPTPRRAIEEGVLVGAATVLGSSLCDGLGDLVSLASTAEAGPVVDLAYRILQGARLRTTRTEYISCPSCGRTLFDLEETTARIKQRTTHLSGVKIAVMGCIVNGPGEMADADFGYVGSGVGQVTLYVGKQIVERAVPEAQAPDRLVELIKRSGRWVDA